MNPIPTFDNHVIISHLKLFLIFPNVSASDKHTNRLIYEKICISTFVCELHVAPIPQKFYCRVTSAEL